MSRPRRLMCLWTRRTHEAMPDSESVAIQRGVGSVPGYVAVERTPATPTCGRVRSMLIGLATTVAAPPSVAVIVLVTDCPPPPPANGDAPGPAPRTQERRGGAG